MFNWSTITNILEASTEEEIYKNSHQEFKCIIDFTSCFDAFSETVKIHRLNQVIETLSNKAKISQEEAKNILLSTYYQEKDSWFTINIDGFDRPIIGEEPYVKPEDIYSTKYQAGYLLPDGTFYGCQIGKHYNLTLELQRAEIIPNYMDSYAFPDENGWLKIGKFKEEDILNLHNANQIQLDIIKKLDI